MIPLCTANGGPDFEAKYLLNNSQTRNKLFILKSTYNIGLYKTLVYWNECSVQNKCSVEWMCYI